MRALSATFLSVPLLAALYGSTAMAAEAPRYTVVVLPGEDGTATAINNSGVATQVIGYVLGQRRAAYTDGSSQSFIPTLGGTENVASDINSANQIVGASRLADNTTTHAYVYRNGTVKDLGTLGGDYSSAQYINDAGTIVGTSRLANGDAHAFIYTENSGMVDIGTFGGAGSYVSDIDASGRVLGAAQTASGEWRNFLYENGTMTALDLPLGLSVSGFMPGGGYYGSKATSDFGGGYSYVIKDGVISYPFGLGSVQAVNAGGYAVGMDAELTLFGRLTTPEGGPYSLDDLVDEPGWSDFFTIDGINDAGQIIGTGCRVDIGCTSIRLDPLSPVPEPAAYAMLGAGLAMLAWTRRRKQRA
ncbi:PEP-CTERM sorting domain-containing protein [Massilia sp. METH4]|uniref:PEP-CTERM sorting domain-containing protein n=1 Tax=Massilia sp. METH4 TaxID=3123041 RepID=UPI0030D39DFF